MALYEYYKIKKEHIPYHGDRYFQINMRSHEATTVVLSCGDVKKGKGNQIGAYSISKLTVYSNYLGMNRCERIASIRYFKAFKTAIKIITNP